MTSQGKCRQSNIFVYVKKNESLLTIMAWHKGLSGESATGWVNDVRSTAFSHGGFEVKKLPKPVDLKWFTNLALKLVLQVDILGVTDSGVHGERRG